MARKKRKTPFQKFIAFIAVVAIIISSFAVATFADSIFDTENENDVAESHPPVGYCNITKVELIDHPDYMKRLFEKNEEAYDFVLSYFPEKDVEHEIDLSEYENCTTVPLFMQWDIRWGYMPYAGENAGTSACGPVCLSMVGYYLTKNEEIFAPDKVITYAIEEGYSYDDVGTLWSLMDEGATDLGLISQELSLDEDIIIDELEQGHPIICIMGPGVFTSSGHFIVLTSYSDGYYTVNDPNSYKRSEKKWKFDEFSSQILNLWSYCV
ncbi:MAG: C39 family peptidase [Acutalibacteraceae bacterium]